MPPPPSTAGADTEALRRAIAAGQDGEAARLLRLLAAGGAQLLPATFAELAAAGLPPAAVALAQHESGQLDLAEADATDGGGSYLHAAAAAGTGTAVLTALIAAGASVRGGRWAGIVVPLPDASSSTDKASPSLAQPNAPIDAQAAPLTAGTTTRPPRCTLRHVRTSWTPAGR